MTLDQLLNPSAFESTVTGGGGQVRSDDNYLTGDRDRDDHGDHFCHFGRGRGHGLSVMSGRAGG